MEFFYMRILALFAVGVIFAEVVGYLWHFGVEHKGWLGDGFRHRHWIHHTIDYPVAKFCPEGQMSYKDAGSWSWYVLATVVIIIVFLALPVKDSLPLIIGGVTWGKILDVLHQSFHIRDHGLNRLAWFRELRRRHYIHHWTMVNYGIAFFFLDGIFGTFRAEFPQQQEELFPSFRPPKE